MATLVELIEREAPRMTANQRRIADFVLLNPRLVATMGIEELAKGSASSAASVTRFVRRLGLPGYSEFRGLAVEGYRTLLRPADRQGKARGLTPEQIGESCFGNAATLIDGAARIDAGQWGRLAGRLRAAECVGILGLGLSAALGRVLAEMIEPFTRRQILLDGTGGGERMARLIQRMGPDDQIVALGLARYSRDTLNFMRLAKGRGVPCTALTDGPDSPLVPLSDEVILVPCSHPVLHSSAIAMVAAFEAVRAILFAHHQTPSEAAALTRMVLPHLLADDAGPADAGESDA